MSFEERLDRLTERHEALAQTVEVIAAMQRENEKRFEQVARRLDQLGERVDTLAAAVQGLFQIAQVHERRLTRLEN